MIILGLTGSIGCGKSSLSNILKENNIDIIDADIIKIAMINVYKKLEENNMKSKLILQVHDELIVEAVDAELDIVKRIVKDEMENAVSLDVNLDVDLNIGDSWYETK